MEMTLATGAGSAPSAQSLTRRQKAAIVVCLLRSEGIELSLAELPDQLQIDLTKEVGNLRIVSRETLKAVVEEFVAELERIGLSFPSGIGAALKLLEGTISADTAERLRSQAGIGAITDPWERLSQLDAARIVPLIEEESTEIGAIALSKIKVSKAAEILGLLPGQQARRLAYAMGQTGSVRPETVARIGKALIAQIDAEAPKAFSGGPVERVGAILNFSPSSTRDDVLEGLDEEDKAFADEVRKAIFTFVNIPQRIDPRDVPKIIREVDGTAMIAALAAASPLPREGKSAEFILSNMSQRLAQQMRDEMEALGTVKQKDGEEAMNAVVTAIREMESKGEIMLVAADE